MPLEATAAIAQRPEDLRTFDGVDRRGRIIPDEMRGDSAENKQVELIVSRRWLR